MNKDRTAREDAPRRNLCYGCNRVEAPPGDTVRFYCGGCAEWDAYSMDTGETPDEEE